MLPFLLSPSYIWQHIEVGYVQGMCDLLAPLLVILDDGEWRALPPPQHWWGCERVAGLPLLCLPGSVCVAWERCSFPCMGQLW